LADFDKAKAGLSQETLASIKGHAEDIPGFFADLPPIPGAVEAFHELAGLYDVYILSTAPWQNVSAWSDKRVWVEKVLGEKAEKRLILSHRKDLSIGNFLVDDRAVRGASEFKGQHLQFGTAPWTDWAAILPFLCQQA